MKIQELQTLFAYNTWANNRILNACLKVTPEQLIAPAQLSHTSLRGTLVHTLDSEHGWRMRCQHNEASEDLEEANFPNFESLQKYWAEEEAAWQDYLAKLTDEDLTTVIRYTVDNDEVRQRVIWHSLVHVINHGTQHRSESAILLTNYGASPGDLDLTVFLLENGYSTSTSGH
jgi:uncharacterized damage-inducible protein DinB